MVVCIYYDKTSFIITVLKAILAHELLRIGPWEFDLPDYQQWVTKDQVHVVQKRSNYITNLGIPLFQRKRTSARRDERGKKPNIIAMALSKAGVADVEKVGVHEELAEKLVQRKVEGKLKNLSDVVALLENSGTRYNVNFENKFKVHIDEKGEIELQCREREPGKKKKSWKRWSLRHRAINKDQIDEEGPAAKKNRRDNEDSEDEESDDNEEKIDVNTANEEELETLEGIGPSLARKIVRYREKHGVFRRIEELSAVKGVSKRLVSKLEDVIGVGKLEEDSDLELITIVPPNGCLQFEGREAIRIMSWNLQCFSDEKADNKGVVEVICRSILENGISVAVIQEIGDETALEVIQNELNQPTLKSLKKLKRHNSNWKCVTSDVAGPMFRSKEFNGFLFDSSRNIELKSHDLLEKPKKGKKQFARRPFLGYFKASGFDFIVVSVHLKATGLANEDMNKLQKELAHIPDVVTAIKEQIPGERDLVIVGDFNLDPDEEEFDSFREAGLTNLIPHTSYTNISRSNMDGSKCYDNIWITKQTMNHYSTGRSGVIRKNMSHPLIPDGWRMGGVVSDHCPVWAEFYCDLDVDKSAGDGDVEDILIATKS